MTHSLEGCCSIQLSYEQVIDILMAITGAAGRAGIFGVELLRLFVHQGGVVHRSGDIIEACDDVVGKEAALRVWL